MNGFKEGKTWVIFAPGVRLSNRWKEREVDLLVCIGRLEEAGSHHLIRGDRRQYRVHSLTIL